MFLAKEKYIKWVHMTISWEKKAFVLSWQSGNYTKKMVNMYVIMITYITSLFDNTYVLVEYILSHLDICQVTHVSASEIWPYGSLWCFFISVFPDLENIDISSMRFNGMKFNKENAGCCSCDGVVLDTGTAAGERCSACNVLRRGSAGGGTGLCPRNPWQDTWELHRAVPGEARTGH